jgi:hypothetical protein
MTPALLMMTLTSLTSVNRSEASVNRSKVYVEGSVARVEGLVARVEGAVAAVDGFGSTVEGFKAPVNGSVAPVNHVRERKYRAEHLLAVIAVLDPFISSATCWTDSVTFVMLTYRTGHHLDR